MVIHSQTSIVWDAPVASVPSEFGYINLRMELDAAGNPVILHGKSGSEGGLYCTRWNDGTLGTPTAVTSETGIFINDAEGPRMAASGNRIAVAYQISGQWDTGGRVVISEDGGATWGNPIPTSPDATEDHFMPVPAFDGDQNPWITVKWGTNPVLEGGQFWDGTTGTFMPAADIGVAMAGSAVCECCASMPFSHEGRHYDIVRNNNANLRDFWVVRTDEQGEWSEAIDIDPTDWNINSCPASEAESCILPDGTLAAVFMSAAEGGSRVHWSTVDLENWALLGSDRIQSDEEVTENNPSLDADGAFSVVAWERSQGGYNILVGIGDGSGAAPQQWANSSVNVTESLTGHSRRPVIRIHGNAVHLVYQRPSEGTFHYLRGTLGDVSPVVSEARERIHVAPVREGWKLSFLEGEFTWQALDMQGRIVDAGAGNSGLVPFTLAGAHVIQVLSPAGDHSFRVVR